MSLRQSLIDYSRGDHLAWFWFCCRGQRKARTRWTRDLWTFFMSRSAHRHGGYVGPGAEIQGDLSLPHGLHGVFISRYAAVGAGCRIYQNVTIGEVGGKAPRIGENCLIGAGAVVLGGIRIGDGVKIGAGAVVCSDIPDGCTVVSQPARSLNRS